MTVPTIQYVEGDSFLHRRHPLVKLAVLVLLLLSLFVFKGWPVPAGIGLVLFAAHAASGGGTGRFVLVAKRFALFLALIVLAHLFLIRNGGSWPERAAAGLLQGLRVFDILAAASLFLAVTDPVDLADSILLALQPVQRAGLPLGGLSLLLMVVFSFLPLVGEEADRLGIAFATRCGFGGGLSARVKNAAPLLAALVVGIMRRSEELDISLAAKRYTVEQPLRRSVKRSMTSADYVLCGACVALFIIGAYAQF